jgi:hypothetical protein
VFLVVRGIGHGRQRGNDERSRQGPAGHGLGEGELDRPMVGGIRAGRAWAAAEGGNQRDVGGVGAGRGRPSRNGRWPAGSRPVGHGRRRVRE